MTTLATGRRAGFTLIEILVVISLLVILIAALVANTIAVGQRAYIDSFHTFKQDFSYRNEEPGLEGSTERLKAWFQELDAELKSAVEALSEDDIANRVIDRGGDFQLRPRVQLEVYKEALLIFYGKVDVYLKAMGRARPEQWREWIA